MGSLLAIRALSFLALLSCASAHGMLCTPRQRGAYHSAKCGTNLPLPIQPVTDYCAHCLNGGTVFTVSEHLPRSGWSLYDPIVDPVTATRAGLCGDAFGDDAHMMDGKFMPYDTVPIVAHWTNGSFVDFEAELDTNHNGYFEFIICNLDSCKAKDISRRCMREGHCHKLTRVPHLDCQNPSEKTRKECGPIDSKYPSRWYVPCRKAGHVGIHIVGGSKGTMRYRLPNGFSCRHCVVQWYWATANSCAPRGFLDYFERYGNPFGTTCASDGGGRGAHRKGMTTCEGRRVPEEFWSCADVSILPSNSSKSVGYVTDNFQTLNNEATSSSNAGIGKPDIENSASPLKEAEMASTSEAESSPDAEVKSEEQVSEIEQDAYPIDVESEETQEEETRTSTQAQTGFPDEPHDPVNELTVCVIKNNPCDGSKPCCERQQVCVYTRSNGFVCQFWYSLWMEILQDL